MCYMSFKQNKTSLESLYLYSVHPILVLFNIDFLTLALITWTKIEAVKILAELHKFSLNKVKDIINI